MLKTIRRLVFTGLIVSLLIIVFETKSIAQSEVTLITNQHLVFDNSQTQSEYRWNLEQLNSNIPNDWSSFGFLVIEMKASSPQRFQLQLHTSEGVNLLSIYPYQNAWIRAALPLKIFSQPTPRYSSSQAPYLNSIQNGYIMVNRGPYLPINKIEDISITIPEPIKEPILEIRSIRLTKNYPGNAVLEDEPLIDKMGQWIRDSSPRKITSLEELQEVWEQEEKQLKPVDFDYCRYGGYCSTKVQGTGFFRVELIDGKWWFVDPDGHLFFSVGVNIIQPSQTTPIQEHRSIYQELPPKDLFTTEPESAGSRVAFHLSNVSRRFGNEWSKGWVELVMRRLQAWGFNTAGNLSAPEINNSSRIPYTFRLREERWETEITYSEFPDVYSEEFLLNADAAAAAQCAPRKNDPFLIGYFIGNEPPWSGNETQIVQEILDGPETATRRQLEKYLAAGDTTQRRKLFFYKAFERYLQVIDTAIRKYDPNHLILGIRYAGIAADEMVRASRVFDVFSVNDYQYFPDKEKLEKFHRLSGKPLLLSEFHFGVPAQGMSAGLKQVRDYQERGVAYRYYVENLGAIPEIVGAHWFQWVDQPNTGRYPDGENYNIGLVDITDRPYPELTEAMQATHHLLYSIHSGQQVPFAKKPFVN
ncbi:MAG: hypothetical protein F6J89_02850 [Symploca sp. SIO1C4]|uniref:Agarase n=1 Tax=Symploca sp. SIO1C4 TaxID=2607765 RepID=A0A6B3N0F9_9CYAN|nr:hypothetical protein [Symploca sp. SIO1C4]